MSRERKCTTRFSGYRDPDLQAALRRLIDRAGHRGLTVAELRHHFDPETEAHHGWVSGATSLLHKDLKIARLTEKREGHKVYVELDFMDGRPVEPYGGKSLSKDEVEMLRGFKDFMDYWFTVDTAGARFATDRTRAERNQRMFFDAARREFGDSVVT